MVRVTTYNGTDIIETVTDWDAAQDRAAEIARLVARSEAARPTPARISLPERLSARQAQLARPVQPQTTRARQASVPSYGPTHFRDSAERMARTADEAQRAAVWGIAGAVLAGTE